MAVTLPRDTDNEARMKTGSDFLPYQDSDIS